MQHKQKYKSHVIQVTHATLNQATSIMQKTHFKHNFVTGCNWYRGTVEMHGCPGAEEAL